MAINNSAKEVVEQQRENFNIEATLTVDRQAIMKQAGTDKSNMKEIMDSAGSISKEDLENYADSSYVKSLNYQESISLDSSTTAAVSNTSSGGSVEKKESDGNNSKGQMQMIEQGDFKLIGYSSTDAMTKFIDGSNVISDGEMFESTDTDNNCVINEELAFENDIAVGDKISLNNPNDETKSYEFTVVGIFTDNSSTSTDGSAMNLFSNSANEILTNYTAVNNIYNDYKDDDDTKLQSNLSSTFILNSNDDVENFTNEVKAKGLNDFYTVSTNTDSFDETIAPLNNLINFSTVFLLLVLIIGGIILVVLNMFNVRERKYEVGVLRAIGMKKGKVAAQFIAELFVVTFAFLTIGTVAGAVSSVPVANYMLQTQIQSTESQQQQIANNFGKSAGSTQGNMQGGNMMATKQFGGSTSNITYVNQINAVISPIVVLEIAGIGLLLTILSSGISLIFISRYEPLKILSSRS